MTVHSWEFLKFFSSLSDLLNQSTKILLTHGILIEIFIKDINFSQLILKFIIFNLNLIDLHTDFFNLNSLLSKILHDNFIVNSLLWKR